MVPRTTSGDRAACASLGHAGGQEPEKSRADGDKERVLHGVALRAQPAKAGDRIRPAILARAGRRLTQAGAHAATTPIRLAPGGYGLARMEDAGAALLAGDADLGRRVASQRRPAGRGRAGRGTCQDHASFLLLLTDRHGNCDVASDARNRAFGAHATATPEGTHAVRLAVHVAEPASAPK